MKLMSFLRQYKKLFLDFFVIILLGLTPLLWFPKGYLVTGHDAAYPLDILEFFKDRLFTWRTAELFGRDYSHSMGGLMTHSIEAIFKVIGFSLYDAQKLNFVFWFVVMGLSMYYFAYSLRHVFKYRYFPLFASIIYIFNFYLLALWRMGAGTTFAVYAALPLVTSFFIRFLLKELSLVKAGVYISLLLFFFNGGGGLSVPLFGGLIITLITALFYFALTSGRENFPEMFFRCGKLAIIVFVISLFLDAYWLLPFLSFIFLNYSSGMASQGSVSGAKNWTDMVSAATSMVNLFRWQGFPDWYQNPVHTYASYYLTNPILIFLSFLFAPLAYVSLLVRKSVKEHKLIVFFAALSLVALFFSAGTHKPSGWLFGFFMDFIPGFAIFRSAQYKFIPALYFSFAILISFSLSYWLERISGSLKRIALIGATVLLILLYHFPFFGRDFFVWNKPLTLLLKVPDYVFNFKDWSRQNLDKESRLLLLPRLNTSWRAEAYNWGYYSLISLFNLFTTKPIVENQPPLEVGQEILVNRLYDEILNNGPLISSISALLQTPLVLLRNDSFFNLDWVLSEDPRLYKNAITRNNDISPTWQDGEWEVYQLPTGGQLRKVYGVKSLTQFTGPQEYIAGAVVAGSNNFVQDVDMRTEQRQIRIEKAPIFGQIYSSVCESCLIEKELTFPQAPPVQILPDSIFYFIKEWKEKKLENSSLSEKQLLGNKLGLSVARTTELNNLIELRHKEETIKSTSRKLYEYWYFIKSFLDSYIGKPVDFKLLRTIQSYSEYERSVLVRKYDEDTSLSDLTKQDLGRVIKELDSIGETINKYFSEQDWSVVKEYIVPTGFQKGELFLDLGTLNKKLDGSFQLPEIVEINNKNYLLKSSIQGEKVSLGVFDLSQAKTVRLHFPESQNLLVNIRTQPEYYPYWQNNCLMGDVSDFSWQKEYKIKLEIGSQLPKNSLLFVRPKRLTISQKQDKLSEEFSSPPYRFTLEEKNKFPKQNFSFKGKDGDISAAVYFCTSSEDPGKFVKNMKVELLNEPGLFFVPNEKSQISSLVHNINYERIDSTKYRITLPPYSLPMILVFNEQFNSQWRLFETKLLSNNTVPWSWLQTWFKKPVFFDNHFQIYGFANAWYIDQPIKDQLILEFYPQQLFYQGAIVTVLTLFLLLLGFMILKRKVRKMI